MPDIEKLKKLIAALKTEIKERLSKDKDSAKDPALRKLKKRLRRAQRKLRFLEGRKRKKKEEKKTAAPAAPQAKPAGT